MNKEKNEDIAETSPLTEKEWEELEQFWAKEYDALWNISKSE